jgi:hypothetical protein
MEFEGTTNDGVELFIRTADPTTTDKIITFPDDTGTVCLSSGNCAGGSGGSKWTDGGATTYLSSTTDNLAVGDTGNTSEFFIDIAGGGKILLNPTTGNLNMQDRAQLAKWNRTETIVGRIPISNFEDPLYLIATAGRLTNSFNKTLTSTFVQGSDVSALLDHATNSRYIASTSAPSFINRLQGQITTASPYGIESLVNLQKLAAQGISLQDKSCVDYIYFSNSNPTSYHVTGMPSWFKIDSAHIPVYQVNGLTY